MIFENNLTISFDITKSNMAKIIKEPLIFFIIEKIESY